MSRRRARAAVRPGIVGIVFGLLMSLLTVAPAKAAPPPAFKASFLIPAYFYPLGNSWQQMCSTLRSSGRQAVVIMNPGSGPGPTKNPEYTAAIALCRQQPLPQTVVGYVDTNYGKRSAAAIKADIDNYYSWYSVNGIFFDQMSNSSASKALYVEIYNYVKTKSAADLVVGNPGIPASTNWQLTAPIVADVLVVFEGNASTYMKWQPPKWVMQAQASTTALAHIVYGARPPGGSARLPSTEAVCAASKLKKGGWMDVTSNGQGQDPNPYDGPPDLTGMQNYC